MARSGGGVRVLSRAKPVSNRAAVLIPPPRRTPATGSVRLTVRRRAGDVKGGSPAEALSRAAIGARPAGSRGTIGLGRTPRGTPAARSVRLAGRERARDIKGRGRAEILSRTAMLASIGARPGVAG